MTDPDYGAGPVVPAIVEEEGTQSQPATWRQRLRRMTPVSKDEHAGDISSGSGQGQTIQGKWSFGVLNDRLTDEVPGKANRFIVTIARVQPSLYEYCKS